MLDYWGYELTIPPSQLSTLSIVHSISSTLFNFLTGMSVVAGESNGYESMSRRAQFAETGNFFCRFALFLVGVPEMAPFVKYLSSYVDIEFKVIQSQDKGNGVVLAATCEFFPSTKRGDAQLNCYGRQGSYPLL